MTIHGSCLCGALQYEVTAPLTSMLNCHCSRCRKEHGAPFATFATTPAQALHWIAGQDAVVAGVAEPGMPRLFCVHCGSPAPTVIASMGVAIIPVGTLDGDPGLRPEKHFFVGSKAAWHEITDALPQHQQFPPELDGMTALPDRAADAIRPGIAAGSCLCGDVTYEMKNPIALFQCHCTRCRKARGAAHGANVFCGIDDFQWTHGEERVTDYKLPEARYYGVAFCSRCGAAVPRVSQERGIVVVPVSGLDTDPGMRPMAHIFVGSKAPWFEITDSILQYPEAPPSFGPTPATPAR